MFVMLPSELYSITAIAIKLLPCCRIVWIKQPLQPGAV
jgi:hypothetical protein